MIDSILGSVRPFAKHRVWIFSDLQQSEPAKARAGLSTAVEDYRRLGLPCDRFWYLGDAIEGDDPSRLEEMAAMHVELLEPLGVPLRYALGNHDLDLLRSGRGVVGLDALPFARTVGGVPGWCTIAGMEQFYFMDELGDYAVVFLSDHAAASGEWASTHGVVHGDADRYPHGPEAYEALRREIAACGKPVILAGHYAFAGGNRPSALLNRLLPLPDNVLVHFHGHAHIGDAQWAGKDCYRKIGFTEGQPLVQINVSSLENDRGSAVRSVFLEIYEDGGMGVYFRDHDRAAWAELYVMDAPVAGRGRP
jgi:hypothetical protein